MRHKSEVVLVFPLVIPNRAKFGDNDEPTPDLVRHLIPAHRFEELTRARQPRWPVGPGVLRSLLPCRRTRQTCLCACGSASKPQVVKSGFLRG